MPVTPTRAGADEPPHAALEASQPPPAGRCRVSEVAKTICRRCGLAHAVTMVIGNHTFRDGGFLVYEQGLREICPCGWEYDYTNKTSIHDKAKDTASKGGAG